MFVKLAYLKIKTTKQKTLLQNNYINNGVTNGLKWKKRRKKYAKWSNIDN